MCGIFGYVGTRTAEPILLEALRTLEYRGYDSAGIFVPGYGAVKAVGPIDNLAARFTETIGGTLILLLSFKVKRLAKRPLGILLRSWNYNLITGRHTLGFPSVLPLWETGNWQNIICLFSNRDRNPPLPQISEYKGFQIQS